jgi:uncharacterized protein (TIGR03084 family)
VSGPDLGALASHLAAETDALLDVLDTAPEGAWQRATPSIGWTVADQIAHLAYFDEAATASVAGEEAFSPYRDEALELGVALPDVVAERFRARTPEQLRAWWPSAREVMVAAMLAAGPSARIPWYGPTYSVASAMTGRIMETWAHGRDVYDALGATPARTPALYDVARLCARTRANSYAMHGMTPPPVEVGVVLTAPDGSRWRFGDDAPEAIIGEAEEFCLVATQRRHPADTSLVATGPAAAEWLGIAQAFTGPPGEGRAPGGAPS